MLDSDVRKRHQLDETRVTIIGLLLACNDQQYQNPSRHALLLNMLDNLPNYLMSDPSGSNAEHADRAPRNVFCAVEDLRCVTSRCGCMRPSANGYTCAQATSQWLNQLPVIRPRVTIYQFWCGLDPDMVEFLGIAGFVDVIRTISGSGTAR